MVYFEAACFTAQTNDIQLNGLLHRCPDLPGISGKLRPGIVHRLDKDTTGCIVIVGEAGVVCAKSTKQKIVVKSSTEAELVALSDALGEALYIANFLRAQGYTVGPVRVHEDNKSCIDLVKRGHPCSDRSKHLDIRRFWMADRSVAKDIVIVHEGTDTMWANMLTKPLQGFQFKLERYGVMNWGDKPIADAEEDDKTTSK